MTHVLVLIRTEHVLAMLISVSICLPIEFYIWLRIVEQQIPPVVSLGLMVALAILMIALTLLLIYVKPARVVSAPKRRIRLFELRRALVRGEIEVFYQPVVSLEDGTLIGFEALARWHHPRRGLLLPNTFIPLAEQSGLIIPLGAQVLAQACRQTRQWHIEHPGRTPLTVSVNLSACQLQHPTFPDEVAHILQETCLPPECLNLEITESTVMHDMTRGAVMLRRLKDLGIQLSIDDFGTGYSSLNYLRCFPVDILKIDRSFVEGLGKDPKNTAIVQTIIRLGQTLGINVVGEGLETDQQIQMLREFGCDRGQGYFFARPMTVGAIDTLMLEPSAWLVQR